MSAASIQRKRARARSASARPARGFTLIELLISIIIIGILAVMAIPSMSIASYDRDTYNDAGTIMQIFRSARTRAIARGSAVVVQMVTTGAYTRGGFFTYEATSLNPNGATGAQTPTATCKYPTTWSLGSAIPINGFALGTTASSTDTLAGIMAQPYVYASGVPTASAFSEGYVCFTPLGRAYTTVNVNVAGVSYLATSGATNAPVFSGTSSTAALEIRVTRTDGATIRSVLVPNNGMARLFSHTQ